MNHTQLLEQQQKKKTQQKLVQIEKSGTCGIFQWRRKEEKYSNDVFLIISLEHTMRTYFQGNEKEHYINSVYKATLKTEGLVSHFSLIPGC